MILSIKYLSIVIICVSVYMQVDSCGARKALYANVGLFHARIWTIHAQGVL